MKCVYALGLIVAMLSCNAHVQTPIKRIIEAQETTLITNKSWSITLPSAWKSYNTSDNFIAHDNDKGLAIVVKIHDLKRDNIRNVDFGTGTMLATLQVDGINVIAAMFKLIDDHPGSVVIYEMDDITLLQYAMGVNGNGYIVACGGKDNVFVARSCKTILDTFHVKNDGNL